MASKEAPELELVEEDFPSQLAESMQRVRDISTSVAFGHVRDERRRQFEKWGEQNHSPEVWLTILMEEVGEASQAALHDRFGGDHAGTFLNEMVQVAAVAVQIIEQLTLQGYPRQ